MEMFVCESLCKIHLTKKPNKYLCVCVCVPNVEIHFEVKLISEWNKQVFPPFRFETTWHRYIYIHNTYE